MRFVMDRNYNKKDVISIGLNSVFRGSIIVCIISAVIYELNKFDVTNIPNGYLIFLILNFLAYGLYNTLSYYCRGEDKVKLISTSTVINALLVVAFNLIFLLIFNLGLTGYLIANTLGILSSSVFLAITSNACKNFSWHTNKSVEKEMILFSIPMVVNALSWWINSASDRYILTAFSGMSIVGIYSAASKIPAILSTLGNILANAFSISAIKDFDSDDSDGFISNTYKRFNFGVVLLCSLLIISNRFIANILYSMDFYIAWRYVPFLLLSVVFNLMSDVCAALFLALKKTKIISATSLMGAIINTCLNFVLIPIWNGYGAAISTIIGFFAQWVLRYILVLKSVRLKISKIKIILTYVVLVLQIVISIRADNYGYQFLLLLMIVILNFKEFISIVKGLRQVFSSAK